MVVRRLLGDLRMATFSAPGAVAPETPPMPLRFDARI